MNIKTKTILYGFLSEAVAAGLYLLAIKLGSWGPCGPQYSWTYIIFIPTAVIHIPAYLLSLVIDQLIKINYTIVEIICFVFQWIIFSFCCLWYLKKKAA